MIEPRKKLRILLSAYACEPGKGSEPGVGWQWALALARRGHEVWVITRENNRQEIEAELERTQETAKLHFLYYDLPIWARSWKKGGKGVHLYYLLWQLGLMKKTRKLHECIRFNLAHHITFGVFRQSSYLWRLGIPFVFGPLGGGERAPFALRRSFGWVGWSRDLLRDVVNVLAYLNPALLVTFYRAYLILVKTSQSADFIPKFTRYKTIISQEIGINTVGELPSNHYDEGFRVLFVGRFVYFKGGHLAIRAFAEFAREYPNASFTLVGRGPEQAKWISLAIEMGVENKVNFIDWMPQAQLAALYRSHHVCLFPSLHDSSGNVVLEALSYALPVICLALGGPAMIVDERSGRIINVKRLNEREVIGRLASTLLELATSTELLSKLRAGALTRAREYSWEHVVSRVYSSIEDKFFAIDQESELGI